MKSMDLTIGRREFTINVLDGDDPSITHHEIPIIADPNDEDAIRAAASATLQERVWFLKDDVHPNETTQRFMLHVSTDINVELTVLGDPVARCQIENICETLSLFWDRLRNKGRWNIRTIQIPAHDEMNPKSGQLMRGREFISENRFYIYPTALRETGRYRDALLCTWLQGTIVHEATHVCLETQLENLWHRAGGLGWTSTPHGTLVRYPGGSETRQVNMRPEDCPTEYATYSTLDDHAESVVAFLYYGRLHKSRYAALLNELRPETFDLPDSWIEELPRVLPPLPRYVFRCTPSMSGAVFNPVSNCEESSSSEPIIYPVDEYRRRVRQEATA